MSNALRSFALVITLTGITTLAQVRAQDPHAGHDHGAQNQKGPNGGMIQTVGQFQVETVVQRKGVMFMVFDMNGNKVSDPSASGTLSLKVGKSPKAYEYKPHRSISLGVVRARRAACRGHDASC